jgi:hypothetical protein
MQLYDFLNLAENMDHSQDGRAVPELKAALTSHSKQIQSATDDQVYDIIDRMMTRIAKSHGISGQKLHDMWVDKYGQIPDTWIMKIKEERQRLDPKCWTGYKKQGTKLKGGVRVNNCVPKEGLVAGLVNTLLVEYDRSKTAANFGEKILAVAAKDRWLINEILGRVPNMKTFAELVKTDPQETITKILEYLERGDPTPHKEYTPAIAKMYANGQSKMEDIVSTLADYLTKFDRLKRKKKIQPPRNDFNRYRNLEDFYDVVDEYPDEEEVKPETKQNAQELYRDNRLIVTVPRDVAAACYYGQGTRWCTAGKNNNMYDYYTKGDRPLYIIIPRQPAHAGEKYQFHFETKQFMNEQDHQIGMDGIAKLVQRFPELTKILQAPAEKYSIMPLIGPEYKNIVTEFTPVAIKQTAELVNQYADRIIGFGFKSIKDYGIVLNPQGEQAIEENMRDYLAQCLKAMTAHTGIWNQIMQQSGTERNEDKIESMLSSDELLKKVSETSQSGRLLHQELQNQKISNNAVPHVVDLVMRDPLFRFLMRQIPKMYTAKLQENGHALA